MRKPQILVIGSSDDYENFDVAYQIGSFIAKNNWILITGGRTGIMEAACKGAYDNNGIAIGILPSEKFDEANPYCNIVIPTGIGFARNYVNVLSSDCVISIHGQSGTLIELAYAWQFGKTIIACSFTGGWSKKIIKNLPDSRNSGKIIEAKNIDDVFYHLKKEIQKIITQK